MSLASPEFLAFVGAVYAVFSALPGRLRHGWLLAASFAFYGLVGAPCLLLVLAAGTAVAFVGGRMAAPERSPATRRAAFWVAVAFELLILASLKYVPAGLGRDATVLSAVGVSYWVLQAVAYLSDVYLEIAPCEPRPTVLALHLAFFPKLVQGPIERPGALLPQLHRPFTFDYQGTRESLVLIGWGLFQKLVIADRAAPFVGAIFDDPGSHAGAEILVASYAYAAQIVFDFSGYTDIARGVARLFGVTLVQNFDAPYLATSVSEFWRRWHISFSRWLLDYVFKPLQFQLRGLRTLGTAVALLATFLVSGAWHGAAWTFVAWGALHGTYMALAVMLAPVSRRAWRALRLEGSRLQRAFRVVVTFHLVSLAWVFFRARTLSEALLLLDRLRLPTPGGLGLGTLCLGQDLSELTILLGSVAIATLMPRTKGRLAILDRPAPLRWGFYGALVLGTVVLRASDSTGFLYARF